MKREEIKALGIEDDKIDAIMKIHGVDVESHKSKLEAIELERDNLKESVKVSQEQLKELEGLNPKETAEKLKDFETKFSVAEQEHEKALKALTTKHAAEKFLGKQNFSSELAREAALDKLLKAELTYDEKSESFMGGDDFITKLKETSPTAFVVNKDDDTPPPTKWGADTGGSGGEGEGNKPPTTLTNSVY